MLSILTVSPVFHRAYHGGHARAPDYARSQDWIRFLYEKGAERCRTLNTRGLCASP